MLGSRPCSTQSKALDNWPNRCFAFAAPRLKAAAEGAPTGEEDSNEESGVALHHGGAGKPEQGDREIWDAG